MIFPDHLPDAARMISHETMKNALRPKNYHGLTRARRRRLIAADYRRLASHPPESRADQYRTRPYSARRGNADRG